jgi:hypothetical protein
MGYGTNGLIIIMISPAMMNFLESQPQQGQQPMQGMSQDMPSPVNNSAAPAYNPFDTGISKAIASARESLGMTQKQQDKALRSSMLAFANNIAQQPKQRGFFNNFASVGRALSPAISTYDTEENAALNENNALANQVLKYQGMEQDRQAQAEEQAWRRQHAERQLAEQARGHNLMDRFKKDKGHNGSGGNIDQILKHAEDLVKKSDSNTHRGFYKRFFDKFTPGGIPLTKEQAEINTIGDVLRGKLFNTWGYRNQAEFEHVPSLSPNNSKKVNLAIIEQLKTLMSNSSNQNEASILPKSAFDNDNSDNSMAPTEQNDDFGFTHE